MTKEPCAFMLDVRYFEGMRTSDGLSVTMYRGPSFAPYQCNVEGLDWGAFDSKSRKLAEVLLKDVRGWQNVPYDMIDDFARSVIAKLPTDRKWRLWSSEIGFFAEKIYRERLAGRKWPQCGRWRKKK